MSQSLSRPTRRSGADATLAAIDSALSADVVMCFCGCGRMVDGEAPSLYFATQSCSEFWHRSERYPDPPAWRASIRAGADPLREPAFRAELFDMARPDFTPRPGDGPTALDRLEPRRAIAECPPFRVTRGHAAHEMPQDEATPHRPEPARELFREPETAQSWGTRVVAHVSRALRRPVPVAAAEFGTARAEQREAMARVLRIAIEDGNLMAQLERERRADEQRRQAVEAEMWSVTYMFGGVFSDESTWHVQVGNLSEYVTVQGSNHHQRVMESVERLRAQQRGRME